MIKVFHSRLLLSGKWERKFLLDFYSSRTFVTFVLSFELTFISISLLFCYLIAKVDLELSHFLVDFSLTRKMFKNTKKFNLIYCRGVEEFNKKALSRANNNPRDLISNEICLLHLKHNQRHRISREVKNMRCKSI